MSREDVQPEGDYDYESDLGNNAYRSVENSMDLASTQVNLTDPRVLTQILDIQNRIDPADLFKFEDEPHVTVRYGIEDVGSDRVEQIVRQYPTIQVRFKGLSVFENGEEDVLKIDVDGSQLRDLNRHLGILPNQQVYAYQPHLTVAYLKPGVGKKYAGRSGLEDTTLLFKSVFYSDPDRNKTEIVLNAFCPGRGAKDNSCPPANKGIGQPPSKPTAEQYAEWLDKGWGWGPQGWEPPKEKVAVLGEISAEEHRQAASALSPQTVQALQAAHAWEQTKPWNMSRGQIEAGEVPFLRVREGRNTERAEYSGEGVITLKPAFFEDPHEESRRHMLYHELGHQLADTMSADLTAFRLVDAEIFPRVHWMGSGNTPEEFMADAYATLITDPGWLETRFPASIKPLRSRAQALGMPLPQVQIANGEWLEAVENAFCPTGEGGGQKNTCPPANKGTGSHPANKLPADWQGEVEILDAGTGEVLVMADAAEVRRMLADQLQEAGTLDDLHVRKSTPETKAEQARAREDVWRQAEERAREAERVSGLQTPHGVRPGHPEYVPPPERLYHATFEAQAIRQEGIKSGEELGVATLGGSSGHLVSFTTEERAEAYRDGLALAQKGAAGQLSSRDLLTAGVKYGLTSARAEQLLDEVRRETPQQTAFEYLQRVSLEGQQFPLFMGGGWPDHLRSAKAPEVVSIASSAVKDLYYNPSEQEWRVGDYHGVTANVENAFCPGQGAKDNSCPPANKRGMGRAARDARAAREHVALAKNTPLTHLEKITITDYTGGISNEVNSYLRTGKFTVSSNSLDLDEEMVQSMVETLDGAISKSPGLSRNTTLLRHTSVQYSAAGEIYHEKAYTSTTMSKSGSEVVAKEFGAGPVVEIQVPKGVKVLSTHGVGEAGYSDQMELILPRDGRFKVIENAGGRVVLRWMGVKPITNQLTANAVWKFLTLDQKLKEFTDWVKAVVAVQVLAKSANQAAPESHWLNQHINRTFAKGMERAYDYIKKPQLQSKLDFYLGSKAQFLQDSFMRPVSQERVKLLASRAFNELQGVTDQMATQMQRTLTDGFVRGDSPWDIARNLTKDVDDIGIKRAQRIARTEVVRAHNEGQLEAMENLGVAKVGVAVEWTTSGLGITKRGNPSPCKLCAPLKGVVMSLKDARGLLPRHPNCMCSYVPANVGESTDAQIRTEKRIRSALDKSIAAERPAKSKRTVAQQKRRSRWAGSAAKPRNAPRSIF